MARLNPLTPIFSAADYGLREFVYSKAFAQPYGTDAKLGSAIASAPKKTLTIIVVGETARAHNFSLNGYGRETNPELSKLNVLAFQNATSCGTATAISLPCMFSHLGRENYSKTAAYNSENLVDVLHHAGLHVEWWDNNAGSKGVAARIPSEELYRTGTPPLCSDRECLDQALVDKLKSGIGGLNENAVLVLHMMGSHGPAYYRRYPDAFRRFAPDCQTAQLTDCSQEQLVNSYDNTIAYTDHVLAQLIGILQQNEGRFASSLIYMSDHGESLGEDGLYLHGAPYNFAPDTQKRVPVIAWFSKDYEAQFKLNTDCVRAKTNDAISHDNLFDTALGMMSVETSVYRPQLDLFASCRGGAIAKSEPASVAN